MRTSKKLSWDNDGDSASGGMEEIKHNFSYVFIILSQENSNLFSSFRTKIDLTIQLVCIESSGGDVKRVKRALRGGENCFDLSL